VIDRDRHRLSRGLAALALLAIAVSGLLGGFAKAPPDSPRMLQIGEDLDVGPLRIRPLRAWIGPQCPLDYSVGQPNSCLSFEAEVTNITNSSRTSLSSAVRLLQPVLASNVFPTTELVRDRWVLGNLHPHLPERVVMSWKLPPQTEAPSRITLSLWRTRFKKRDNLQGGEGWFNPQEAARIELPLTEPDPDAMRVRSP
jgi:hypothetical protein